jgi:hypothetical protein
MGRGPFCGGLGQSRRPTENLPRPRRIAFHKQFNADLLAGFRLIEVPADADGPVLKGAMWYPCPEAAVLILTNQGGETL